MEPEVVSKKITLDDLKKKMADFAEERDWDKFHSPINLLLALLGEVGELAEVFQWKGDVPKGLPDWEERENLHLGEELSDVLLYLVRLSDICGIDLGKAVIRKLELNALKDPAKICKRDSHIEGDHGVANEKISTLYDLKKKTADLAEEDWNQLHSPRNLLLALACEVGKLVEIFQWKGEVPRGLLDWKEEQKLRLGEKLSKVLLYLVRLSDICCIDLGKAALRKLELNGLKYPAKICKEGSVETYNNIHRGSK